MHPLLRLGVLWLLATGAGLGAQPAWAAPPTTPDSAPLPRIVVGFANQPHVLPGPAASTGSRYTGDGYRLGQSARQQARHVAAAYSLRELESWPIEALAMHCVVFEITNGRPMAEVLAALVRDRRVMLAQPLQEFHTLGADPAHTGIATPPAPAPAAAPPYNDPLYDLQTNLVALGIARAHQRAQGAGVRIALIDTGVDAAHPDLEGRIAHTRSFIALPARSAAQLRHGTAMAGVIAAVANNHVGIVGIAPLARLEVFEACWQVAAGSAAATCNTFTLAQALAAALAADTPLVNLSLAGPADPLLTALVLRGLARGITYVAATAADAPFPAAIPGVISAAGTEAPVPAGVFAAPATHVLTTRPGGQYDFESGTSVAAAELTGVIALLMSAAPTRLRPAAVVTLLQAHAPAHSALALGAEVPAVDVNAGLAQLDGAGHGTRLAGRQEH